MNPDTNRFEPLTEKSDDEREELPKNRSQESVRRQLQELTRQLKSIDAEKYSLRFSPRRSNSVWSMYNIRRVERLTEAGLMTAAGLERVEEAQRSGQWQAVIDSERTDVTEYAPIDKTVIRLLYSDAVQPGMGRDQVLEALGKR